ncbi:hypothetical protein ACF9IK_30665 [Kitasatospora hibisci]|uniref:hypothetical protein n=1 Tax=Kitasatospora hibisci TaxID=3369522 RepID=UPI0037540288
MEGPLSTRSVIARPTDSGGYTGIYCHYDGYPSHQLPLLLTAYQHRFSGDVEAMAGHLIDAPVIGWSVLGNDLLDGAPERLRTALAAWDDPSKQLDARGIITPDGSPPAKDIVTHDDTGWLDWGYVLHPHGIEVINLYAYERGPVVPWDTDPGSRFSDEAHLWSRDGRLPLQPPPPTAAAAARASSGGIRSASAQPASTANLDQAPATVVAATSAAASRAR